MRTVSQAVHDAVLVQKDLEDRPALTSEDWSLLGDRCIHDAIQPCTSEERYADSIRLAALCYRNAIDGSLGLRNIESTLKSEGL